MGDLPYELIMVGVGLVLTVGTGFFVASEFTLVNLNRTDLESRTARGEKGLGMTISALRRTSTHLSSAQLGITLTTLLTGFTLEPAVGSLLTGPLGLTAFPAGVVAAIASVIAIIIATLLSMIVGELVPKNFALALPIPTAKLVIPFQVVFSTVFRPFVALLNGTANAVLRVFGITPREELSSARTADELRSLVRRSASEGGLPQQTATLLSRTLVFSKHEASDVMTSRPQVTSVERDASAQTVLELAKSTGFSRFPVVEDGIDDVVGLVHVKDVVRLPREEREDTTVAELLSDIHRVPETMKLDVLLIDLRQQGHQMAVVEDEYGGTAGIVTLEDLVEEVVGEVADEHDVRRPGIYNPSNSTWLTFPGLLRPDELLERTGIRVPEEGPYETVTGYIQSELGRLPAVGEEVPVEGGTLRVDRLDGRRIDRVRFTPAVDRPATGRGTHS